MTNTTPNNPVSSGAVIEREEAESIMPADTLLAVATGVVDVKNVSSEQKESVREDFSNFTSKYLSEAQQEKSSKTFNEMSDEELLKCLSEYLGSGVVNSTINIALVEVAQQALSEMFMSDEELAELDNPTSPRAKEIQQKKLQERMQDFAEEKERRMEERRAEWDAEMHDFGGERLSGTEIMRRIDWYNKPENKQRIRDDLKKQGLNDQQIKDIEKDVERRNALYLLMRDKKATPEQEEEYKRLNNSSGVRASDESVSKNLAADAAAHSKRADFANLDIPSTVGSNVSVKGAENKVAEGEVRNDVTSPSKSLSATSSGATDFPSAEAKEIKKNFTIAANTNTPVAAPAPAPVVVASASVSTAKIENSFAAF